MNLTKINELIALKRKAVQRAYDKRGYFENMGAEEERQLRVAENMAMANPKVPYADRVVIRDAVDGFARWVEQI